MKSRVQTLIDVHCWVQQPMQLLDAVVVVVVVVVVLCLVLVSMSRPMN